MTTPDLLIKTLEGLEAEQAISSLFTRLPETTIWEQATPLIQLMRAQDERGLVYLPMVLEALAPAVPTLSNQNLATLFLMAVLTPMSDSIVYHNAVEVVITHATLWTPEVADIFLEGFRDVYLTTYRGGDEFIAEAAVKGAVELPLRRNETDALKETITMILQCFPDDPADPCEVSMLVTWTTGALAEGAKLLTNTTAILEKLTALTASANNGTAIEALFYVGSVMLTNALRAETIEAFHTEVTTARSVLERVVAEDSERSDAELLILFCRACEAIIVRDIAHLVDLTTKANQVHWERTLFFGHGKAEPYAQQFVTYLSALSEHFSGGDPIPSTLALPRALQGAVAGFVSA